MSLVGDLQGSINALIGVSADVNGTLHAYSDAMEVPASGIDGRVIGLAKNFDQTIETASAANNYLLLNNNVPASLFSLTSSLAGGSKVATLTRADATSCATVMGYAPTAVSGDSQVLLTCIANEPRYSGARRISANNWSAYFADGTPIPDIKGLLTEPSRTNLFLQSATGTTQTTPALTAASYTLSFKGTGSISSTGGFVGTLAGTGATNRVSLTVTATAATATMTVTGSITEVQLELGANASSYIPTTAASVTRAADVATIPTSGNITAASGSVYVEWTPISNSQGWFLYSSLDGSNQIGFHNGGTVIRARKYLAATLYDATMPLTPVIGTTYKLAMSWGSSGVLLSIGGVSGTPNANTANAAFGANIAVFGDSALFTGKNLRTWITQLTQAQLNALTA